MCVFVLKIAFPPLFVNSTTFSAPLSATFLNPPQRLFDEMCGLHASDDVNRFTPSPIPGGTLRLRLC
jgi:hypothetical protein